MEQVGKESRFQTWTWVAILVLVGVVLAMVLAYITFGRDIEKIND